MAQCSPDIIITSAEQLAYMQRTGQVPCQQNIHIKKVEPIYRSRNIYNNMASSDPSTQYYRQKIIQNTVRVSSSLYTMNLGALNVYQSGKKENGGVNWNQMSDRREPHVQQFKSGSNSSAIWRRVGPGSMSPGGAGVDVKHNSYERYLNRLKGRKPVRRGVIPADFGTYIPFNRANPVYGGKTLKTAIVNGCTCPEPNSDSRIVANSGIQNDINTAMFTDVFEGVPNSGTSETFTMYNSYVDPPSLMYIPDNPDNPDSMYGIYSYAPDIPSQNVYYPGNIVTK
jgi:hypothetical protein